MTEEKLFKRGDKVVTVGKKAIPGTIIKIRNPSQTGSNWEYLVSWRKKFSTWESQEFITLLKERIK